MGSWGALVCSDSGERSVWWEHGKGPMSCDLKILLMAVTITANNVYILFFKKHTPDPSRVYVSTLNEPLTTQMSVYLSFCHLKPPIVKSLD